MLGFVNFRRGDLGILMLSSLPSTSSSALRGRTGNEQQACHWFFFAIQHDTSIDVPRIDNVQFALIEVIDVAGRHARIS